MAKRILILDANSAAAANLKTRLDALGEVQIVRDEAGLTLALGAPWDLMVADATLPGLDGAALMERLQPKRQPILLYTDDSDLVDAGTWKDWGLAGAFNRTQRADLVTEVERRLEDHGSTVAPHFLLVEDSATVRQFVKAVLRQAFEGSEIIEADDGRTALAAMKSSRVSLIITDLQMPGMDGLSFVQLLRNNAVLKKKPVIVLSGAVTDEARESLSQLEKVQILAKPATPDLLVGAVRTLMG